MSIKAGAHFENVNVSKKKTKLMFVGEGIGKTVVKANRSVVSGWTTFQSATVWDTNGFSKELFWSHQTTSKMIASKFTGVLELLSNIQRVLKLTLRWYLLTLASILDNSWKVERELM